MDKHDQLVQLTCKAHESLVQHWFSVFEKIEKFFFNFKLLFFNFKFFNIFFKKIKNIILIYFQEKNIINIILYF